MLQIFLMIWAVSFGIFILASPFTKASTSNSLLTSFPVAVFFTFGIYHFNIPIA